MTKRYLMASICLLLLGLVACRQSKDREIDKMIDIGTHSLHIRCTGQGRPVVVVDTGAGDTSARWTAIQAQIAQITRVCTYDRAGYGSSEPGPLPRHSRQIADELQMLLDKAKVPGPYLLVGHSLGAINMQVFADRYPDQVAGLILLDPPPVPFITGQAFPELYQMFEGQTIEFQNMVEAARKSTDAEAQAKASYWEAVASEHGALIKESAAQVVAIASFSDLPLVVIGSGVPNPGFGAAAEDFQQFWIEQSRELATNSTNGKFVLAQESRHHIHEDAPDVVLDAIREMVE